MPAGTPTTWTKALRVTLVQADLEGPLQGAPPATVRLGR
jgi:hypothetical protein